MSENNFDLENKDVPRVDSTPDEDLSPDELLKQLMEKMGSVAPEPESDSPAANLDELFSDVATAVEDPAPAVEEILAPFVEEEPTTPAAEEILAPFAEEEPTTPATEEILAPFAEEEPTTPAAEEVLAPFAEEDPAPVAQEIPAAIPEETPAPAAEVPAPIRTIKYRISGHTKNGVDLLHPVVPEPVIETPAPAAPVVIPVQAAPAAEVPVEAPAPAVEREIPVETPAPVAETPVVETPAVETESPAVIPETPIIAPDPEPIRETPVIVPDPEPIAAEPEPEPAPAFDAAAFFGEGTQILQGDEPEPAAEEPAPDEGMDMNGDGKFDQTDINIMLALGLDDQLAQTIGADAAAKATKKFELQKTNPGSSAQESARDDSVEFVNLSQTHEILDEYARLYSGSIFKIIASAFFAIALLIFENISLFGIKFTGAFSPSAHPLVYCMADLQLLVFALAVVYKSLFKGFKNLLLFRPSPHSILALASIVEIAYTVGMCFVKGSDSLRLFGFPVAVIAFLSALADFFILRREILSFNIVSSKKTKYALTLKEDGEDAQERGLFTDNIDEESTVAEVKRATFIDDFFARTEAEPYYSNLLLFAVLLPLLLSVAFFFVTYLSDYSVMDALSCAVCTFMFCVPASAFFNYSVPFYRAEKIAYSEDGAIIGDDTLDEFASTAVLTVDDTELFQPANVKVRSIRIFGEHRIDRVIYMAASVFRSLGGILGEVFRVAAGELGCSENVTYTDIADEGITATVDGNQVMVGSRTYMTDHQIALSDDPSSDRFNQDCCVMYLAVKGEAAAKMFISYEMEGEMNGVIGELIDSGICLGVNSSDPNITEAMLRNKIPDENYPIKVLRRPTKIMAPDEQKNVSSGIVGRGTIRALISSILLCDKVRHVVRVNNILKVVSIILGMVISVFLLFTGNSTGATSLFSGAYSLLWLLPMLIITHIYF